MIRSVRAASVFATLLLSLGCGGSGLKVADVEGMLKERLPVGSSSQQVSAVLDSMKVEHSAYDPAKRDMLAMWRRTKRSLFDEQSIQAQFQFDEGGRLVSYNVEELSTGS
jgi:hypothetical protein